MTARTARTLKLVLDLGREFNGTEYMIRTTLEQRVFQRYDLRLDSSRMDLAYLGALLHQRLNEKGCEMLRAVRERQNDRLSPLLRLPPELRNIIYDLLLNEVRTHDACQPPVHPKRLWAAGIPQALLHVCRRIRNESSAMFYHHNTFAIRLGYVEEALAKTVDMLRSMDDAAIESIRRLRIITSKCCPVYRAHGAASTGSDAIVLAAVDLDKKYSPQKLRTRHMWCTECGWQPRLEVEEEFGLRLTTFIDGTKQGVTKEALIRLSKEVHPLIQRQRIAGVETSLPRDRLPFASFVVMLWLLTTREAMRNGVGFRSALGLAAVMGWVCGMTAGPFS